MVLLTWLFALYLHIYKQSAGSTLPALLLIMEEKTMAQNATVMAFRKRLAFRGYTEISIKKLKGYAAELNPNSYQIKAKEPLGKQTIIVTYNINEMYNTFK